MKILKNKNWIKAFSQVFKRFPVVLSSIYVIGILFVVISRMDYDPEWLSNVILAMITFTFNALIIKTAYERYSYVNRTKYLVLIVASAVLSILLYFFVYYIDRDWSMIVFTSILFAQVLLTVCIGFLDRDKLVEHFAAYITSRLAITLLIYLATCGGVCGLIFALEELFNIVFHNEIYSNVFMILGTTLAPMLWLGGFDLDVEVSLKKLFKVLLVYILIPLLLVYSLVVYVYIFKIMLDGFNMPSSIIGHLVLWYSFVSVAVMFLSRPFADHKIGAFFHKYYSFISIAPLAIMFVSIFMRINQYGYTINRYYVLVGGIWLAFMYGYFIFTTIKKKYRYNIVILLSLAVISILCITEPISAMSISKKSQINRIKSIIGSKAVEDIPESELVEVKRALYYLEEYYKADNSKTALDDIDFLTDYEIESILNMDRSEEDMKMDYPEEDMEVDPYEKKREASLAIENGLHLVNDISDYDNMITFASHQTEYGAEGEDIKILIDSQEQYLVEVYKCEDLIAKFELESIIKERRISKDEPLAKSIGDYTFDYSNENVEIRIIANYLKYSKSNNEFDELELISGVLLFNIK